ncbi:MAG: phosphoribosyltransferase family protein [Actinomycetaceae bacterium]|nr:phosphoribosyltransferase family protein [Actinomycetaceae bacterium]
MHLLTTLADLAFPRSCAGCGAWDTALCDECSALMAPPGQALPDVVGRAPYLNAVRIHRDGLHMPGDPIPFFRVWSLGDYEGRRRAVILAWKNTVDAELTAKLRAVMARAGALLAGEAAVAGSGRLTLVPAPSRWRRRHDGRFVAGHLAEALAGGLADAGVNCQVADALRLPGNRSRASLAGRAAKAGRVRLATRRRFAPSLADAPGRDSPGLHGWATARCLLVDDVLTTGATLAGCARVLGAAGASVVGAVVLAAAADPREASG